MAQLALRQIKISFAFAAMTTLLAACGGGSAGDSSGGSAAASPSASSNQLAASGPSSSLYAYAKMMAEQEGEQAPAAPSGDTQVTASVSNFTSDTVLLAPVTTAVSDEGPDGQNPDDFRLTFYDNFEGDLSSSAWNLDGISARFNASTAVRNYATSNGSLKIWPERGSDGEFFNRTLDTKDSFTQQYGYFEIEAKLPKGKGVWPAFWLLSMTSDRRPEIDILEAYPGGVAPWGAAGADGVPAATMYAPVVWRDADDQAGYGKIATPNLSDDFHRYGAKWEPNKVTFYFDGEEVHSVDASLSEPMFMILNLWFGSASGQPDSSTPSGESNALEVNYVKAWQFK